MQGESRRLQEVRWGLQARLLAARRKGGGRVLLPRGALEPPFLMTSVTPPINSRLIEGSTILVIRVHSSEESDTLRPEVLLPALTGTWQLATDN